MNALRNQSKSDFRGSLLVCLLFSTALVGCGGGLTQEDMKRMGIRRNQDEKKPKVAKVQDNQPEPPAPEKPSQPEASAVATSATKPDAEPDVEKQPQAAPSAESAELSDTQQKPAEPLSFEERGLKSIQNMERIVAAMEAYREANRKYPVRAAFGPGKSPLLSWRVELLPYLGYQKLYDAFEKNKPWNSPVNKALLDKMPAVYQSPERFDTKTNYCVAVGTGTIFGRIKTLPISRIEDGVEHTLLLVEVDENLATPWTKPQDYEFAPLEPKQNLGSLRGDHVFVGFGEGLVGAVPLSLADQRFKAMFTAEGDEAFSSYSVTIPVDQDFFASVEPEEQVQTAQALAASPGSSRRSRARSAVAAASPLAKEYLESARLAYSMHDTGNALLWMYASNILQPASARWDEAYRWVPALQRPAQTVHFCVGVRQSARIAAGRGQGSRSRGARRNLAPERGEIVARIAEVGESLLEELETHAVSLIPPDFEGVEDIASRTSRRSRRGSSEPQAIVPVTYLGLGSRSELASEAIELAADVLVLFDADLDAVGGKRWVSCELIDLARGQRLLGIPKIYWYANTEIDEFLERDDAYKQKLWLLKDTLADELTFADWPSGIKPRHIEARMRKLADLSTVNPLIALSEMCVYRNRKLIDTQQLLTGYRFFLGEDEGEALLLGSEKKKKRILRDWLPAVEPSELQQLAHRQQRTNRDDDD